MVSLSMVVLDVLVDDEAQVPRAERDDSIETLRFGRADEPLRIRKSGTLRRKPDRPDAAELRDLAKDTGIEGFRS